MSELLRGALKPWLSLPRPPEVMIHCCAVLSCGDGTSVALPLPFPSLCPAARRKSCLQAPLPYSHQGDSVPSRVHRQLPNPCVGSTRIPPVGQQKKIPEDYEQALFSYGLKAGKVENNCGSPLYLLCAWECLL